MEKMGEEERRENKRKEERGITKKKKKWGEGKRMTGMARGK